MAAKPKNGAAQEQHPARSRKTGSGSPTRPSSGAADEDLAKLYALRRPLQEEFTLKLVDLLRALLRIREVDVHLLEHRTKDISSFQEKIGRVAKSYTDPMKQITDLSGIRIILYYEKDVDIVGQLIESEFDVDWSNSVNKKDSLRPEEFGYQSVHYVVRLSEKRHNLLEWQHMSELRAELQVRTVLQHAWAAISHKLQYKREADVPATLKRKLSRLSALLELADEQFLAIRDETTALSESIEGKLASGETDLDINLLTIDEFLRQSEEVRQLEEQAREAGYQFVEVEKFDQRAKSNLVALSHHLGLTMISQLKNELRESLTWSGKYLKQQVETSGLRWEVSPSFICVIVLIRNHIQEIGDEILVENGWHADTANHVLQVAREFAGD